MSIRKLRKKTGLNQAEFARALGIPKSSMCRYEAEQIKPSFDIAYRIVNFLKKHGIPATLEEVRPG